MTEQYKEHENKFTGKLAKVVIDLTPEPLSAEDEQKLKEGQASPAA